MNQSARILLALVAGVSLLLSGCSAPGQGKDSDKDPTTAASASSQATDCPTKGTGPFAMTSFVTDVGLVAGTFYRYVTEPHQQGRFAAGATGRDSAILKAGMVAAIDTKLVQNAIEKAKAVPELCEALVGPLSDLAAGLPRLRQQLNSGDLEIVTRIQKQITSVMEIAGRNGMPITPNSDLQAASNAQKTS
ncbi:MAG TPA: hypothetical protein PLO27_04985 [Marmoricola sp.]|nr:hypothetical protein [Marmoricola sp.]HNI70655.1 hypothetical protein [Marmoricola sp.]